MSVFFFFVFLSLLFTGLTDIASFCRRFASWVEGDSHVTEEEMSAFEDSIVFDPYEAGDALTDDENEIDFRLSSS